MPSHEHVLHYGFRWPDDLHAVSEETLLGLKPAGPAPLEWSDAHWADPPRSSAAMLREIATSRLSGNGIEFGAGTSPVAVPLHCRVLFADAFSPNELRDRSYHTQGDDFVHLSFVAGIEEMAGIDNDSLDFIVAAHVIEHTRNPLKAIQRAHDKLKVGGSLVLFVPDKRLTFDSARETTTIEHLAADYQQPSVERDREHYVEFFSKAFVTPPSLLEQRISDAVMMNHDIHFHTWTYDSFRDTVQYVQQTMFRWSDVWSQPPATSDPNANEFYFVLRK